MVTISEEAKLKVLDLLKEENKDASLFNIRVGVKGGGCSGLSYVLEFDDTILDTDEVFEDKGIKILCDKKSLLYLWGTELKYTDGLNGKGFEWSNPNASRVCGCGSSFSV
jgi:iron-sulfur cluster assembly protein